jgi:CheY-like chemotaxis protein
MAGIPVIIYTTVKVGTARQRAFEAGADYFLSKPFLPNELRDQVNQACACS